MCPAHRLGERPQDIIWLFPTLLPGNQLELCSPSGVKDGVSPALLLSLEGVIVPPAQGHGDQLLA